MRNKKKLLIIILLLFVVAFPSRETNEEFVGGMESTREWREGAVFDAE